MIVKGGKINDRYQIVKTLGEGGMANVYLAYDTILNRDVAVKILRGDLANDEKFVRRFQREALSASSLSHPNIVEMYDVGEDEGQYYIVMEYVEGKTLKQLLKKRGHLTVTEVIDIMLQLTDGIAHAHDSYIIHRDIKPQNVMILENGLIKITDFGIAMALNSTQLTQTNSVMGSVHYLPPEQANGKGSTIKSDIYSIGILMYELLTGCIPYRGDNAVEIALKHLKEPLPSIKDIIPDLPQSIENVILKSTAKNPQNRYRDAREMYDDLKTALDNSRVDEDKYIYPYPDGVDEDTKVIAKKDIESDSKLDENDKKKQNKLLVILLSIFTGLAVITASAIIFLPKILSPKEINVPNVAGMSVIKAEQKLEEAGFKVDDEIKEISSDKIKEGKVVKTSPGKGRSVKKGTTIILYVSTGSETYKLEDYTGKNANETKAILEEVHGLNVIIEEKEDSSNAKENTVISQIPEVGEKVKLGDTVTLYIPKKKIEYPDFTNGAYTLEDVREFCKENDLSLNVVTVEDNNKPEGSIIKQSRPRGSYVLAGYKLEITITKTSDPVSSTSESEH